MDWMWLWEFQFGESRFLWFKDYTHSTQKLELVLFCMSISPVLWLSILIILLLHLAIWIKVCCNNHAVCIMKDPNWHKVMFLFPLSFCFETWPSVVCLVKCKHFFKFIFWSSLLRWNILMWQHAQRCIGTDVITMFSLCCGALPWLNLFLSLISSVWFAHWYLYIWI